MSLIIAKNKVDFETLMGVETPVATESFQPIGHHTLVLLVKKAIENVGLIIVEEEHSLAQEGQRYFGGFALTGKGIDGKDRQVVLGLRNSHNKSFAAAICLGSRMLVCENLCFSSDVKLARRHTTNILRDIERVIADAVGRVLAHWNDMGERIKAYQNTPLTTEQAENLIVKLVDSKAFPARDIYNAIQEFRKPSFVDFEGQTMWSLYNAITFCLKGGDLSKLPYRTMTCQSIFDRIAGHRPVIEVQEIITKGCEDNPDPAGTDMRDPNGEAEDDFETLVVVE
jgi:hypothetical protein